MSDTAGAAAQPVLIDPAQLQAIIDQAVTQAVSEATAGIVAGVDTAVAAAEQAPPAQTPTEVLLAMLGMSGTPNENANVGQWLAQYGLEDNGTALVSTSAAPASSPGAAATTGGTATPGAPA